jgi:uncharacterized protein
MGIRLVVIQSTSWCNLNCSYCYVPNRKDTSRISDETLRLIFQKTLRSSLVHDPVEFLWHAGEPLMVGVEFYRQAFAYSRKYNVRHRTIKHAFQTNGTLINDEWCKLFKENDVNVGISIDGPEFIHDKSRVHWAGAGSHAKAVRGLKLLQEYGINTGGIAVLTAQSLDYPDEIFNFFLEHDFTWIGFNVEELENANVVTSLHSRQGEARVSPEMICKYRGFMGRLFDLWVEHNRRLEIREFFIKCMTIDNKRKDPAYYHVRDEVRDLGIITFQKNGDMSTHAPELAGGVSETYNNFVVGNIHTMGELDDFLGNEYYMRIRDDINQGLQNCADECMYFDLCGGGSPSNKFYENGSLKSTQTGTCVLHQQTVSSVILEKLKSVKI